jgi:[acyl-carrier-protein] S-malonyltransferase
MASFAFIFPGQGSQSVGMLDAWGDHPAVLETLKEASDALGENLAQLIQQGPKEALALTTNTQPVMLVAGVAAYRAWLAEGGTRPDVVAGHSLGEYSALVASGVLSLPCRQPYRWGWAPWPPSWGWPLTRSSKAVRSRRPALARTVPKWSKR